VFATSNNWCLTTAALTLHIDLNFISVVAENSDSKLFTGEDETGYRKHKEHERPKLHVDKEQADDECEVAAAVNAADGRHTETTAKGAAESFDGSQHTGWLPGWNLSSLTQLTGAVTSTVKLMLMYNSHCRQAL